MASSRIEATAGHLGYDVRSARSTEDFWRGVEEGPALVLLATHRTRLPWEALLSELSGLAEHPPVLAFGSHVDTQARDRARAAGATRWVPNSVLAAQLPELIRELARGSQPGRE